MVQVQPMGFCFGLTAPVATLTCGVSFRPASMPNAVWRGRSVATSHGIFF